MMWCLTLCRTKILCSNLTYRTLDDSPGPSSPPLLKHLRLESSPSVAMDIAEISNRNNIADHEKYQFINHHFSPDLLYKFPKNSGGRSFQHQWVMRYPWLRYSTQEDGGYCFPCVLFYKRNNLRAYAGVLC